MLLAWLPASDRVEWSIISDASTAFPPHIVKNARDAEELKADMAKMRVAKTERALAAYSYLSGIDFKKLDLDTPLPKINGMQSLLRTFKAAGSNATLRDIATGNHSMLLVGTADSVAVQMQKAMEEIGGDGFLVAGHIKPKYVHSITDELVPALQKRQLTRTEYSHATLRKNLRAF